MFTKIIKWLEKTANRFHITAVSENTLKYAISDPKEDTYRGVSLRQIWSLKFGKFSSELT